MKNAETDAYWQEYLSTLTAGAPRPQKYIAGYFGSSPEVAEELAALILAGTKTATAGLKAGYVDEGDDFPQPGDLTVITDYYGHPLGVIETTHIEIRPFKDVDASHAYLEGEGDRSLAFWRDVHWRIFVRECAERGEEAAEDMPVVCEQFRLVYPLL